MGCVVPSVQPLLFLPLVRLGQTITMPDHPVLWALIPSLGGGSLRLIFLAFILLSAPLLAISRFGFHTRAVVYIFLQFAPVLPTLHYR
jgi:hypothetical protein